TVGAALLAANLAITVPLVLLARSKLVLMVGAASLLGLPPLGGFPGMLLVAQAASGVSVGWLGLLLLGSALAAAGWLSRQTGVVDIWDGAPPPGVLRVLLWVLIVAQFVLVGLALWVYVWILAG